MNLLVLITFVVLQVRENPVESAFEYNVDGRNYYVSTPDTANWYEAMRFCTFNGLYLVDVRTDFENSRILSIIKRVHATLNTTLSDYWTSGTDLGNEGQYYWATNGNPILFTNWAVNEPSTSTLENCVHFYQASSMKWNDNQCDRKMYFICRDTFDVPTYRARECSILSRDSF